MVLCKGMVEEREALKRQCVCVCVCVCVCLCVCVCVGVCRCLSLEVEGLVTCPHLNLS